MNQFTKEELQIIHLDMIAYIHRTTILAESPSHKALRDKVEALINNYCEHEPHGDFHTCVDKCKKCGVLIDEQYS